MEDDLDFDEFKRLSEGLRKDDEEFADLQKSRVDKYSKSTTSSAFYLKMMLENIVSDIRYLQNNSLDYGLYFVMIVDKITSLEDRINANLRGLLDISKRVKETETLQDQLVERIKRSEEDADQFKQIARGVREIVEARRKEHGKEDRGEGQTDETR